MRSLLVLMIFLAGTGMAFRAVVFASGLFLFTDIFQPLSFARMGGGYPVAQYVFVVLIAAYIAAWARGKLVPRFTPFFIFLFLLIGWNLICTKFAYRPDVAWETFVTILKYLGPIALIHTALQTQKDIRILIAVLAGSVGIWAAQAGAHCLVHGVNTELGIPGGQMAERNDFAAATVGTIPVILYFVFSKDLPYKWILRPFMLLTAFLSLMMIFFSLSRGGAMGLAASMILYLVYVSKRRFRDLAILVVAVTALFFVLPQDWFDRMHTIKVGAEQTENSAAARMNLMKSAYKATMDHPILGLGPGCWIEVAMAYAGDEHNPHNIYLVLSSETGIPGLILYLLLIGFTYIQISKTITLAVKRGDADTARLASALIMSIFGLLSAMTFLNRPYNEYLWGWIAIANALPGIYQREIETKQWRAKKAAKARLAAQEAEREAEREAGSTGTENGRPTTDGSPDGALGAA